MNLLLEHSKFVEYYTYLAPVFEAVPRWANFTYLITDLEVAGETDARLSRGPLVIPGADLRSIVQEKEVQFVWAVLSAFDHVPEMPSDLPYADGNTRFWSGSPKPQLAGAAFEIVCWDSGATLLIGIEPSDAGALRARYPDIRDLDVYNEQKG